MGRKEPHSSVDRFPSSSLPLLLILANSTSNTNNTRALSEDYRESLAGSDDGGDFLSHPHTSLLVFRLLLRQHPLPTPTLFTTGCRFVSDVTLGRQISFTTAALCTTNVALR